MRELLRALLAPPGISGDEGDAAAAAASILSELGETGISPLGSVYCRLPAAEAGLPHIMLTAHLDRIGLMVTRVTDKGFLRVAPCGGVDRRALAGARVTVLSQSGPLPGVVCAVPPHLSDGKTVPQKAEDAVVDVGLSAGSARARVAPGDRIVFDGGLIDLAGDRVSAAGLDDRAGCAVVIDAARRLTDCKTAAVSVALVTQEEINSCGAATAAAALSPDAAIAVDVTTGMLPGERAEQCGVMGEGPMIGISPVLARRLSQRLMQIAVQEGIACQPEVMAGRTGTDCEAIAPAGTGIPTALISIPLRYMHTPSEVIALSDAEDTARLIAAAVKGGLL